jgi:tRNA A37 threonylcarbamoyladenosine modification protein TsaB
MKRAIATSLTVGIALVAGCASGSKDPFVGTKSIEATVVERQYDPPGSGGASYAGTGNYYLVFEGKEGEATTHYRFRVTQQQYIRFEEGAHVQLVIVDNNLRDIRPLR